MNISVFGLGYVGCVSAACFAKEGNHVIGVDINRVKVEMINEGRSPIIEKDLPELIQSLHRGAGQGELFATDDIMQAVCNSEISLVCVGTPSQENGALSLEYVLRSVEQIGSALRKKNSYHVLVLRSTILPGVITQQIIPAMEKASGKKAGTDFGVVMNPEFLREGTSIHDFYNPPFTVIGGLDQRSCDHVSKLYGFLNCPLEITDLGTAEMLKYACNTFHALKVSFGNEIGALSKSLGIDSHAVMKLFCKDNKLNISPYYLRPGFAFGGSCLPKDVRAINYLAQQNNVKTPLMDSIMESNRLHIERAVNHILKQGKKKIGILGLSFKEGTDDLRESPQVILTENLIGKGFDILIYDKNVSLSGLIGSNKEYIKKEIPHISSLISTDLNTVINHGEIIIIGNRSKEFEAIFDYVEEGKFIYDLVRISESIDEVTENYDGICW